MKGQNRFGYEKEVLYQRKTYNSKTRSDGINASVYFGTAYHRYNWTIDRWKGSGKKYALKF